jgi:hypothetical protein
MSSPLSLSTVIVVAKLASRRDNGRDNLEMNNILICVGDWENSGRIDELLITKNFPEIPSYMYIYIRNISYEDRKRVKGIRPLILL